MSMSKCRREAIRALAESYQEKFGESPIFQEDWLALGVIAALDNLEAVEQVLENLLILGTEDEGAVSHAKEVLGESSDI